MLSDPEFRTLLAYMNRPWAGYRKVRKGVKKRLRRHMQDLHCKTMAEYLSRVEQDAAARADEKLFVKKVFDGFHDPELARYLRQRGKRFVLTAGLVTSICVLFTTVSAMQSGFLAAVVEDCCAANPVQHEQALDSYDFIFDRVTVESIPERYDEWEADLEQLERSGS